MPANATETLLPGYSSTQFMNKRQMKKKYNLDFLEKKVREVFPAGVFKVEIAFYDTEEKQIGIILNNHEHGYFDIIDDSIIF